MKKSISRKAIEQMVYVPDIASLAILSGTSRVCSSRPSTNVSIDAIVTLYPVPSFTPPTPLPKTKTALSIAYYSAVENEEVPRAASPASGRAAVTPSIPVVVTYLAVGCRRKLVVYSWRDGEAQDVLVRALNSTLTSTSDGHNRKSRSLTHREQRCS